jgi:SH3-like domain-containing protein
MIEWKIKAKSVLFTAFMLASAASMIPVGVARAEDTERQTPSGLPVPRYVSLKYMDANARSGPGDDHRLLWIYHVRGLPVQVVAETAEWRRVCDPDGSLSWVHKRLTDGRRMTMRTKPEPLAIRSSPKMEARIEAYMTPRSLASLDRCQKDWCRVRVENVTGWVPSSEVWGTDEKPQCQPR